MRAAIPIVLSTLAVLLGGAALVVALGAGDDSQNTSEVQRVAQQTARATKQLGDVDDAVTALEAKANRTATRLRKIAACIPEMQSQINGLSAEVIGGSVYVSHNQQISSYCQPVMYPPAGR